MKKSKTKVQTELGNFIRSHRNSKGLTQTQLALELGYTKPNFISDWERGISTPPVKKLKLLASVLGANEEILLALLIHLATQNADKKSAGHEGNES
jgi:transcriptional regulator with XRE-family HTH domain